MCARILDRNAEQDSSAGRAIRYPSAELSATKPPLQPPLFSSATADRFGENPVERGMTGQRWQSAESGHSTVMQATSSMQLGSRYHIRAAVQVPQPGSLVIASKRAELAKHDIRRSTSRRSRDGMRRCTIRLPREPASEVAKLTSSLRRLEPPARAARCSLVFG